MIFLLTILLWPVVSLAHVTIDPKSANAGEYAKLVFRVPHGCDGSPTTKITVRIPDGVVSVKPQIHPGWKITSKTGKYSKPVVLHGKEIAEGISEVSWTGGPLDDAYMDEFGMSVKLPDRPGQKLFFPTTQNCKKGSSNWTDESSSDHGHHGKLPAPVLSLDEKTPSK